MSDDPKRPILALLMSNWISMLGVALVTTAGFSWVQSMTDADLKKIITDGKGKMKPVGSVTGPAVDDVVAYVRTLKK
jgi:hypothetical protein